MTQEEKIEKNQVDCLLTFFSRQTTHSGEWNVWIMAGADGSWSSTGAVGASSSRCSEGALGWLDPFSMLDSLFFSLSSMAEYSSMPALMVLLMYSLVIPI